MSAKRGLSASVLFNAYDLSQYLKTAAPSLDIELLEATPFQAANGDKVYITGFRDGKLSLEGFFQSDSVNQSAIDDIFNSVIGSTTKQIVTVSPEGALVLGNRCFLIDADTVNYAVSSPATGLIMSNAQIQSSSGLGHGIVLQPTAALTATGNGTGVDNAAATTRGGAGHIHVTAVVGTSPTLDGKIQHSSDGSSWTDLITFSQKTGISAERVEVTGTVNRHLRFIRTIGGSGGPSFTTTVGFTRF
jgi:hypothetical protein